VSDPALNSKREAEPLLPDNWQKVSPLVDAVLDAPPERRAAALDEQSAGDPALRAELERLVAECDRGMPLLDRPAAERFDHLASEAHTHLLPELVGDRYQIGKELGRGGMARVYLARDLKHGRDVAIKVIRPELSASLGHDRFLREIEIAARLRHPNIVPLYDSGEVGGALYFVMPYEEGPSLRERLGKDGALPIADAMGVLRDIARALAYAHEHGVMHRDVKPDNVMLSGGAAVVADFGIAKAVGAALTDGHGQTLTQGGAAIGTPAYMAPEQAVGDPSTDHRADIYSFGCVAYELFAGKPPFHGRPTHQIIAAHVGTTPVPVTDLRPSVSASVARLIAQCLEKNPDARPQNARELLSVLDETTASSAALSSTRIAAPRATPAVRWVGLALATALVATVVYLATPSPRPLITLAVLPFGNMGADTSLDFVGAQLAEEVASALQRVPGIQIVSRSGARAYLGRLTVDVAEAGARLKSAYVMHGVVRQDVGGWILSADMERAADATSLWDGQFNVSPDQQAGAAERIAGSLIAELRRRFPKSIGVPPKLAANQRTTNNQAYRLYLLGQERLHQRVQNVKESADLFRESIQQDATFAGAYSGLSMALALSPYFQRVAVDDVRADLMTAARRAIDLDAALAQPHIALGMLYQFDYQWDRAENEFKIAIQLDSNNIESRVQYARHLRFRGRLSESLDELRKASIQDPASALVLSHLSYAYALNHQADSALLQHKRALQDDSASPPVRGLGAMTLLVTGHPEEARKLAEGILLRSAFANGAAYVLAKSGDSVAARQRLKDWDARTPQPADGDLYRALTHLGLGDTARALSAMERATDRKEIWHAGWGLFDPMFDSVRGSARFQVLMRRVGLVH